MKRLFFLSLAFILAFMLISCDSGNTGDFKITLKLPIDYEGVCGDLDDEEYDHTYCINDSDQVMLSIYSKSTVTDEYVYADRKLIKVTNNGGGKEEFIRSLKKGAYYRFFVEVTNSNEKLKLTGGIDGILYDDKDNYDVDIFLAPAGDFARVVSDRNNVNKSSLESYFNDGGSKGAASVALKDGRIYMAGGYDLEEDEISKKAVIFDMHSLSKNNVKDLPARLYDHVVAFLDDGSENGMIVAGLGMGEDDVLNDSVWVYNPKSDRYDMLALGASPMTKAKAITIDGDVYIVGGCTEGGASSSVYKISAKTGSVASELFASLKTGRCNHAIADVSKVTVDENGVKTVTPRILVIGGSSDYKNEGKETPILGENFAELVTKGSSVTMTVTDRNGGDDSNLKGTGLIAPAAVGVLMDDKEEDETVVAVLGGYLRSGEEDAASWVNNPSLFVFSEKGENTLVYDTNGTANECARPSAALLGSEEKSVLKYVAVNCGSEEISRTKKSSSAQVVFVLQVKRVKDSSLGTEVFSSSVKDSLMDENHDPESDAEIVDGPVAVDALGQVFMLGGKYIYQVGSYALP
jgi:hypothetical protein